MSSPSPSTSAPASEPAPEQPLRTSFSLRPSVLSPLFSTWEQKRQAEQRQDLLLATLQAQEWLSQELPGSSVVKLSRTIRKRADSVRQAASQLRQLLKEDQAAGAAPSRCSDPSLAVGFCAALEQRAHAMHPEAREFARVQAGEVSPWEHYQQHFHARYAHLPRLQPLEAIFAKPDPEELARQLKAASKQALPASSSSTSSSASTSAGSALAALPPGRGPHINLAGVTHTEGKRKASTARVRLVPGSGRFTVNGTPLGSYFRELNVRRVALDPVIAAACEPDYDVDVRVAGGGLAGQAGAVRTAVARALCVQRPALAERLADMTRWDGRRVERKKPGRKKARRGFQWVKR